jgi:murein DD-endopeptidase MepM/ murein hydrolase activator NlpD
MLTPVATRKSLLGRAALLIAAVIALAACAGPARVTYDPAPGSYYEVAAQKDDSVSSLAKRYQVSEEDIAAFNNLHQRDTKFDGKTVRIPAYGQLKDDRREAARRFARNAPVESRPVAAKGKPNAAGAKGNGIKPPVLKPAQKVQTAKLDPPKQQPQSAGWWKDWMNPLALRPSGAAQKKFLWPVNGQVLSKFGPGPGKSHNNGINILAPRGTPVRAADAGTVTYVGNEIKGYGNLVLITHNDGYVTAYAHSDSVTVARGAKVTRGQPIGYAGTTGGVSQPQLHFELRYNAKPVDPAPHLVATNES